MRLRSRAVIWTMGSPPRLQQPPCGPDGSHAHARVVGVGQVERIHDPGEAPGGGEHGREVQALRRVQLARDDESSRSGEVRDLRHGGMSSSSRAAGDPLPGTRPRPGLPERAPTFSPGSRSAACPFGVRPPGRTGEGCSAPPRHAGREPRAAGSWSGPPAAGSVRPVRQPAPCTAAPAGPDAASRFRSSTENAMESRGGMIARVSMAESASPPTTTEPSPR